MTWLSSLVPTAARSARLVLVAGLTIGSVGAAQAQDFFDFLNRTFSGGGGERRQALPQPDYVQPDSPPLTVRARPRHRRPASSASSGAGKGGRYNVADLQGITIYTDKTLARGDAVMTPAGMRVFNGSSSWPHKEDDFVAIADSAKMSSAMRKELNAMDNASRPGLHR